MHSASTIALAATLFASVGLAAPARRQTESFYLTVSTPNGGGPYDQTSVGACHSGAAEEAMCVGEGASQQFSFNATTEAPVASGSTNPGYLIYTLPSEPTEEQQAMQFVQNSTSNVKAGFFGEGSGPILVAFTSSGEMGYVVSSSEQDFTWYVCPQTSLGYQYNTLSFVAPGETPDNADCSPVFVNRS